MTLKAFRTALPMGGLSCSNCSRACGLLDDDTWNSHLFNCVDESLPFPSDAKVSCRVLIGVSCVDPVNVISGTEVARAPAVVPVVRPGVESEAERTRHRQQQALYRRLFMDIEREQVKENIRQKNHRTKMAA